MAPGAVHLDDDRPPRVERCTNLCTRLARTLRRRLTTPLRLTPSSLEGLTANKSRQPSSPKGLAQTRSTDDKVVSSSVVCFVRPVPDDARAVVKGSETSERVDRIGAVASSMCAVHCALVAMVPAVFGALGLGFLLGQGAEWVFTLIAIAFAAGATVIGWRRHRSRKVVALLAIGIVGLLASRGLEMGSSHEGHHAHDAHHGEHAEAHGGHADRDHAEAHDDAAGSAPAHNDIVHSAGAGLGILSGLLLLVGHIWNLREARRCRRTTA
ncbi:MAG: MerC domain-containing protein [Myxococcota bacterium]